jgi:hypothetical protein
MKWVATLNFQFRQDTSPHFSEQYFTISALKFVININWKIYISDRRGIFICQNSKAPLVYIIIILISTSAVTRCFAPGSISLNIVKHMHKKCSGNVKAARYEKKILWWGWLSLFNLFLCCSGVSPSNISWKEAICMKIIDLQKKNFYMSIFTMWLILYCDLLKKIIKKNYKKIYKKNYSKKNTPISQSSRRWKKKIMYRSRDRNDRHHVTQFNLFIQVVIR